MQDPYAAAVFRAPTDRTTKAYVKNSLPHGRGYALSSFRHQRSVVVSALVQDTAGSPQSKQFHPIPPGWASLASQALIPRTVLTHLFVNTRAMYVSV